MTIAIVGVGLIGTSIALAARRRWPAARIIAVDRAERLLHPIVTSVCDLASPEIDLIADADIVVLAAPVDVIRSVIPALPSLVRTDALVTDVGSTKRTIVAAARDAGLEGFVGGHPMAGAERNGPDSARADLFDGKPWLLMKDGAGDAHRTEAFVTGLGATPVWTDAATHDRVMAAVSHLPQVVASTLMMVSGEAARDEEIAWAGGGLRDTTRLAASPASMWRSILADNRDELAPLLRHLAEALRAVADDLATPDAIDRLFEAANHQRARLE